MKKIIILFMLIFVAYSCSNEKENYNFEVFENKSIDYILNSNCDELFKNSKKYIENCLNLQKNKTNEIKNVLSIDVDKEYVIKNNYREEYNDYLESFDSITYDEYIEEFNSLVDNGFEDINNKPTEDDFNIVIKPNLEPMDYDLFYDKTVLDIETEKINILFLQEEYKDLL